MKKYGKKMRSLMQSVYCLSSILTERKTKQSKTYASYTLHVFLFISITFYKHTEPDFW